MRKVIDGNIYELGITQGSHKESMEKEAARLYPKKKVLIKKSGPWYQIWVYVGPVTGTKDKNELLFQEMKGDKPLFKDAAHTFIHGLPGLPGVKVTAKIHALQLITEYGPESMVKRVWSRLYPTHQIAFVPSGPGLIGVAYTGVFTRKERELLALWAE